MRRFILLLFSTVFLSGCLLINVGLLGASCGDGELDLNFGEACDDGNTDDGDGCDANCEIEIDPACGDGNVDAGEVCDDGNNQNNDGCRADCRGEEICGDNLLDVDAGEQCDDGANIDGDGCDANCQIEIDPDCGDGVLDAGEVCDDENNINGDGCRADCQGEEICGDNLLDVDAGEECDDNNNINGDGCNAVCIEEVCGDGVLQVALGEECDDDNNINNDGCSAVCTFECIANVLGALNAQEGANNQCYASFDNNLEWLEAKDDCVARGNAIGRDGHLVSVTSNAENNIVIALVEDENDDSWLGANDLESEGNQEGEFGWVTGEAFIFEDFFNGQPNNNDVLGQDCVEMSLGFNGGTWNDEVCFNENQGHVCEFE